MVVFNYPPESFFFPNHFIISLITLAIFTLILFIKREYHIAKKNNQNTIPQDKNNKQESKQFTIEDKIAIVGIIITLIVTGFFPFIQKPLLDYSGVDYNGNDYKFEITLLNKGLLSAHNIIISLKLNEGIFSSNLTSEPFLNISETTLNNNLGYLKIPILPPGSETTLIATLNKNSSNNTEVTVYVRSDEAIGYHDTLIISVFYISLSMIYAFTFIYLTFWGKLGLPVSSKWEGLITLNSSKEKEKTGVKPPEWKKLADRNLFSIILFSGLILLFIILFFGIYLNFGLIKNLILLQ